MAVHDPQVVRIVDRVAYAQEQERLLRQARREVVRVAKQKTKKKSKGKRKPASY
jgi:hypothetical protein